MSNYLNIPKVLPFKFYPNTGTPGIHHDDDWYYNQIKIFQTKSRYWQKWKRAVTTKLQIITTIAPDNLKLYDCKGVVIKQFEWALAATGSAGEGAWQCLFDVTDVLTDGIYYLYQKNELLSVKFEAISEGIWIKDNHPNLLEFRYKHSENDFGVIWITGIEMVFFCEAAIMDFQPGHDRNSFIDQIRNIETLSAIAFGDFKLYVGDGKGVAPFILDILNRIQCCDHVLYANLQYELTEGAKWDINRIKNYPLFGGNIDITPARNDSSLQFNDEPPQFPGIIIAYDLDADFFGTSIGVIHITDTEII